MQLMYPGLAISNEFQLSVRVFVRFQRVHVLLVRRTDFAEMRCTGVRRVDRLWSERKGCGTGFGIDFFYTLTRFPELGKV